MKKGFASMYLVYSIFLVFILMMFTTLCVNTYKSKFLTSLKNDIKSEIETFHLELSNFSDIP